MSTSYTQWGSLLLCFGTWLFASSLFASSAWAGDNSVEQDLQHWMQVTVTTPLDSSKRWVGYLEVQPRVDYMQEDNSGLFSSLTLRPAVGYKLTDRISLWQGYAWAPAFQTHNLRQEHRLFQQLIVSTPIKGMSLNNRTRLEQRLLEGANGTSVRVRHQAKLLIPLDKNNRWRLAASDEIMINLNDTPSGPKSGFDQNRAFIGINRRINDHVSAELGYLNALVNRKHIPNRINHVIMMSLSFQLK